MARRFAQSVFVGVAACVFAFGGAARAGAQVYTAVDLGTLPGMIDSYPTGINARGDVVGYSIERALEPGACPDSALSSLETLHSDETRVDPPTELLNWPPT